MCGICGIVNFDGRPAEEATLLKMRDMMKYRGPDDAGILVDGNVGIATRRLSILDLSSLGHMPMVSEDGRYWITYNGEVYNYRALREGLKSRGCTFRSDTDTEVLLQLYIEQGPAMLARCNGMFAIAIWDSRERTLFAARDRMGVKPFYYTVHNQALYFASEEKALFAAGVPVEFDESVWGELLLFRYVSGERTPYRNVYRLLPGHFLFLKNGHLEIRRWWAPDPSPAPAPVENEHERVETLKGLFENSIALRRISDVPVGALLSGGLDSASMAATMAAQAGKGVSSFTVRFAESHFDEGPLAKQVAERWGLDYNELFVTRPEIPSLLEEATWHLDEPLVHGHDLHILAISRLAKTKVTVLLSGEGADEILGGYVRYRLFLFPAWVLSALSNVLSQTAHFRLLDGRWLKASRTLAFSSSMERALYSSAEIFPSQFSTGIQAALEYRRQVMADAMRVHKDAVRQVMYYEQHTYLQSLMDRNDRMTMGASIECREPYLDYRLVEWASRIPVRRLFRWGIGKQLLREAMVDRLPLSVLQHQKWGFAVPWSQYFREIPSLRAWITHLENSEFVRRGPLKPSQVQEFIKTFLAGDDRQAPVVRQLAFGALWYEICVCGRRQVIG